MYGAYKLEDAKENGTVNTELNVTCLCLDDT